MLIYYQNHVIRDDLKKNRSALFIFGDNEARVGYGGQAREMRGEPNAFGIATLWKPGFPYHESQYRAACDLIMKDVSSIEAALAGPHYAGIIFPAFGIGTGLSGLASSAPSVKDFLDSYLHNTIGVHNA